MKKPRDYAKEYREFHGKPERIAERSSRNKTVRKLDREGKASRDGKEVDHKNGDPMDRSNKNLRVVKRSVNRKKGDKPL